MPDATWAQPEIKRLYRTAVGAAAVALAMSAGGASAQGPVNPGCQAAATMFQDACQKTIDVFDYLAPQLASAVAVGNADIGQADALGGIGHFSIGIRASAVDGDIPKVNDVAISTTGPVATAFPLTTVPAPMVTANGGVGLFKGLSLGLTHILGVDALVSALYIPDVSSSNVSVKPKNPLQLGFGGRLGLLSEQAMIPGVSLTYLQRGMPVTTVTAVTNGDSLRVESMSLTTRSWRLVAGKHLLMLGLAAGFGQDKYDASTNIGATVNGVSSGATSLAAPSLSMTRSNYFGDVSLDLPLMSFGTEIGRVSGGTVPTYDSFVPNAAGASRLYASAGFRVKM